MSALAKEIDKELSRQLRKMKYFTIILGIIFAMSAGCVGWFMWDTLHTQHVRSTIEGTPGH